MLRATVVIVWPWGKREDEIYALGREKQKDRRLAPWWHDGVPVPALITYSLTSIYMKEQEKKGTILLIFLYFYYFGGEHSF